MTTWRALTGLIAALWLAGCASVAPPAPEPSAAGGGNASGAAAAVGTDTPARGVTPTEAAARSEPAPLPELPPLAALPLPPMPEPLEPPLIEGDRSSLWDRIRGRMAIADLDGPRVQRWEQYYARRPDYVERMVERGGRYLYHVVGEVERRGLPAELALLPFIESAFNPQAMSRVRASGMWQFMPATGREFELRQNLFRDDRRAVTASTGAALDYLQRLHARFGDWHLALAAYNWGQGNVSRAIKRNERLRKPTDYLSLTMPAETRDYVPKLQAVKNIVLDAQRLGLVLPPLENHPFFARVRIDRDIDVGLAAEMADVPLDDFLALNPQLDKPVILAAGTPEVLLPWARADAFAERLRDARGALASWTAWVAPRTMTLPEVAQVVGLAEAELREVNRIPPRMRVLAGSTLLVPRPASHEDDVGAQLADHAQLAFVPEGRGQKRLTVRIGRQGETVASVARRHRVSAAQVARWNSVSPRASFKAGQTVVVMVNAPAPRQARGRKAGKPARAVVTAKSVKPTTSAKSTNSALRSKAASKAATKASPGHTGASGRASPPR